MNIVFKSNKATITNVIYAKCGYNVVSFIKSVKGVNICSTIPIDEIELISNNYE